MRDEFIASLACVADRHPEVFLITGDLGFGVLNDFVQRFPKQFLNAGVAEQNMTGIAVGMALEGRVVFTYSIGNFPTLRCLEQIRNDAAYHDANVKVVAIGGGFSYGPLGYSHHATEDLSILRAIPSMTVVAPSTTWEAAEAAAALFATPGTCYLRLDKSSGADVGKSEPFVVGRARTFREGRDLTLVTAGGIMEEVLRAADILENDGIECRVLSMHTIKPLDTRAILTAVAETGGIVTIEENVMEGGLGSAVAEVCVDHGVFPRRFRRIGLGAGFSSVVGSQAYLRRYHSVDAIATAKAARDLVRS